MATPTEEKRKPRLRTPREIAARIGVSTDTVIRWWESGALAGVDVSPRAGKKRHRRMPRFSEDDVEAFLRARFEKSSAS